VIDPNLSAHEQQCIRILAKLFGEGHTNLGSDMIKTLREAGLELPDDAAYNVMLRVMAELGATEKEESAFAKAGGPFAGYRQLRISASVLSMARELDQLDAEAKEPRDIVAEIKKKSQTNSIVAWLLIVFFVLMAVATFLNQSISLLQNLGLLERP